MIEINNLTTVQIDEGFLKKVAKNVLEGEGEEDKSSSSPFAKAKENKEADLSIALVGQGRMRQLNKRYCGKNRVTDVLAFPETKILKEKFKVGPLQKVSGLGEIVICLREVKKNAKRFTPLEITKTGKKPKESKSLTGFSLTFEKELATCLIHGILHLLGYDHEKSEQEGKKMQAKQDYYLSQIRF